MLAKSKYFLIIIRHPQCYSWLSPGKVLTAIEEYAHKVNKVNKMNTWNVTKHAIETQRKHTLFSSVSSLQICLIIDSTNYSGMKLLIFLVITCDYTHIAFNFLFTETTGMIFLSCSYIIIWTYLLRFIFYFSYSGANYLQIKT